MSKKISKKANNLDPTYAALFHASIEYRAPSLPSPGAIMRSRAAASYSKAMEIRQLLYFCARISFFIFAYGFRSKIFDQDMPLLEGVNIKQIGGAASLTLHFKA